MASPRRIPQMGSLGQGGSAATASRREGQALGAILISQKKLKPEALEAALATQRKTFLPLGRILCDDHDVSQEDLVQALKVQDHTPRVFLRFFPRDTEVQALIDEKFARENEIIAFERLGDLICVAFANPNRRELIQQVGEMTGLEVKAYQAPWEDIRKQLDLGE